MSDRLSHQKTHVGELTSLMEGVVRKVAQHHPQADTERLWHAFRLAEQAHRGQTRNSGEPYLAHGLTVADILADLRLDPDTVVAGLMHDVVEDTSVPLATIGQEFGADVAAMVDGVTKISEIQSANPEARKAENYRKLVLSIAKDPRTVLIKLADRLHNMRTVQYLERDRQLDMALETMDVYAPLAHRFGIARIKWELEDRAFKLLHPERYFEIESGINQTRAERERAIEEVRGPLQAALQKAEIEAQVTGRPKHFYSIYRKMQAQRIGIDRVYDLLALRIMVATKADCYHALGIIHSLFTPLQDRIKDYIATPKPNLYQSLHTTVRAPGGRHVEIQIRTFEMHERNEIGIAAHWRYKESSRESTDFSGLVGWLRQIMEWQQDVTDPREFMESLKIDLFPDEVFVFSPKGEVFQLPRGATALDFAFHVHSEVGLHCSGAKVNDRLVSLAHPLENRDKVEIQTGRQVRASRSWLEHVRTSRAKHHLRRWFRQTEFEHSVRLGREIIEREAARHKLRVQFDAALDDLAQQMGYSEGEKLLAAVGAGDLPWQRVIARLQPVAPTTTPAGRVVEMSRELYATLLRRRVSGVRLQGVDNLMVRYAGCCQPIPGDEITGVVTRGRGVSVHRTACSNLRNIEEERKLEVTWDVAQDQTFLVKLIVTAEDRRTLLADLSKVIADAGTNIQSGDFSSANDVAQLTFLLEVRNLNGLERIQRSLRRVPGVQKVERFQIR